MENDPHLHHNVLVTNRSTTMHHRMQQEVLSSCGNGPLQLIYLGQRKGPLRHGVLRVMNSVHFILLFLSGIPSFHGLQSLQLSDLQDTIGHNVQLWDIT